MKSALCIVTMGFFFGALVQCTDAVCPNIQLEIDGDSCETTEEFAEAFEPIYKAIFNWVDWKEYYGLPPRPSLNQLATTSFATIESEAYLDETSAVITTNTGGFSFRKGTRNNRFLKAMEEGNRDLQGYNCYPPKICRDLGWCCTFCPCKSRRLENVVSVASNKAIAQEAAKMEEEAVLAATEERNLLPKELGAQKAAPQAYPDYENVCDWLLDQKHYPGCLRDATFHCLYLGSGV